jgi:DNA-binding transcriptional ArsR family regulator
MKSGETKDSCTLDQEQVKNLERITSKIPDDMVLQEDADCLKALADPTRLKIIHLLRYGELCVCEIFTCLDKPQPTVSHHLNILKKAGFIKYRKEGVWVHYSLRDREILKILDGLSGEK